MNQTPGEDLLVLSFFQRRNDTAYSCMRMKGIGERWIDIFLRNAVTIV